MTTLKVLQTGLEVIEMITVKKMLLAIGRIGPTAFLALWALSAQASPVEGDSVRYEILLTSNMLKKIHVDDKLTASIDITFNRLILLSTTDQFYVLGWGGIVPFGKKVSGIIGSYAYTPDSLLMIIQNNELCVFDSLGNLSALFKLPSEGMGISPGECVMYVYDRNRNQLQHALYVIAKGGKYVKLFEVPAPITSVVEMNNLILFATENILFGFSPKSKELKVLTALPKNEVIKSIAVDTSTQRIYFSTDNIVCALHDSSVVIVTDKFGGVLKYFDDGLIVFSPEKKILIRIVGIENKIASVMKTAAGGKQTLTLASFTPISTTPESAGGRIHSPGYWPANCTWKQLNASSWLSEKAGEAAMEGDIEEASFLNGQALQAAMGAPLAVKVPSSPPSPASFGSPENAQVYNGFVLALHEQTKKVINAAAEEKKNTERRKEAEKTVAEKERLLEKIKGQSPAASEKLQDNSDMIAALRVLEQAKRDLKDAKLAEGKSLDEKEQEIKIFTGLSSMYDNAKSGAMDINQFHVKQ